MDRLAIIELQRWGFPGVTKYHPGTVQFQTGSLSQVNPFGTGWENRSRMNLPGPIQAQGLSVSISYRFQIDPVSC